MPRNRRPSVGPRPLRLPTLLLASSLDASQADKQGGSPLMRLPGELRGRIFHFVFTAELIPTPVETRSFRHSESWGFFPRVHTSLLRTCRAIYLEAHILPVALNPVYAFQGSTYGYRGSILIGLLGAALPDFLSAWQFAAINHLVLITQQSGLEQEPGHLFRYASCLLAAQRQSGIYIAAKEGHGKELWAERGRGYEHLANHPINSTARYHVHDTTAEGSGPARDVVSPFYAASTITHLTIRLDRADLWTWQSKPTPQEGDDGMALDPYLGDGSARKRPLVSQMLEMDKYRRACRNAGKKIDPYPAHCWGRRVALFKGLKRLTLHLETFPWRVEELNRIVECAKLWTFPIDEDEEKGLPGRTLSWDGEVTAYRWGEDRPFPRGYEHPEAPKGFDVRIISFC